MTENSINPSVVSAVMTDRANYARTGTPALVAASVGMRLRFTCAEAGGTDALAALG